MCLNSGRMTTAKILILKIYFIIFNIGILIIVKFLNMNNSEKDIKIFLLNKRALWGFKLFWMFWFLNKIKTGGTLFGFFDYDFHPLLFQSWRSSDQNYSSTHLTLSIANLILSTYYTLNFFKTIYIFSN